MLLKRLELQGFKSFADKTVLDFSSGVTAVVGPNGSGKSNISDALRWVMGEMSAKSLRGSNMQDVIFSGTEKRRRVNYAEVSMTLDNSSHLFPVDFEEIVVTRRVYRSGESVYQINRAACRLKDIHALFMDTGLGRDGYSMIGQGSVAQILSTKAEDRRSIFEEAAGVSKYKYRKEEAARKLAGVDENLVRIEDIVSELEKQVEPLFRQSEKARKYLALYEDMKRLDVNMSMRMLEKNNSLYEEADTLFKEAEEELDGLKAIESETEEKINALYSKSRRTDEEQNEKHQKLRECETKSMSYANMISMAENDIKNNRAMVTRIDEEIASSLERNDERRKSITSLNEEIAQKLRLCEELKQRIEDSAADEEGREQERRGLLERIDKAKAEMLSCVETMAHKRTAYAQMETKRKADLERCRALELEIQSFDKGIEETRKSIGRIQEDIETKDKKRQKLCTVLEGDEQKISALRAECEKISAELNRLSVEYDSARSKRQILVDMENDYEGYARSVKAVLKARELKELGIFGTVASLIEVDERYVTAIETALGGALQNIVTESENEAKTCIEYLRKTKSGRATFLPVSSVKGRILENAEIVRKEEGYIGLGSELVRYDPRYKGIFTSLLGRVAVVDNIDNAIRISRRFGYKFRIVTLRGDVLNAGGSLSGGSGGKTGGFLSRAAEIKRLAALLEQQKSQIVASKQSGMKLQEELNEVKERAVSYRQVIRSYEDELLRLGSELEHLHSSLDASDGSRESREQELEELSRSLAASADDSAEAVAAIREEENRRTALEKETEELSSLLKRAEEDRERRSDEAMQDKMELAGIEKDIEALRAKVSSLEEEISFTQQTNISKEEDKKRIAKVNEGLAARIEDNRELMQNVNSLCEEIKKQLVSLDARKEEIVGRLKQMQSSGKELTDKLLAMQKELSRLDSRRVKLELEKENITNRLWDDYELTPAAAYEYMEDITNEKEATEQLKSLKSQIKALGSVNMDSIEEYKNVKERFEFMTAQKDDLEKSKKDLEQVIRSMDELMKEHFSRQFAVINESFEKVFRELFGGGHGRLYLSEPDNVLESGIEIEVQLPGKGLQNINLYSGGEKSFIAIALLFAILNVKPAPFCILDEIDAALDDVNVSRFATYLKNYLDDTQFIVITHRRGTMEAANVLYGVTMQEKGVSKLLSLQIDEVDEDMAG